MFISITHPEIIPLIRELPVGLIPVALGNKETGKLIFKAPKEVLLSAKLNMGFRIYVIPVLTCAGQYLAFATAFFDNPIDPIFIKTVWFERSEFRYAVDVLLSSSFEVHFFNEIDQEILAYEASVCVDDVSRNYLSKYDSEAFNFPLTTEIQIEAYSGLNSWLAVRTVEHDRAALNVKFSRPLFDEGLQIFDLKSQKLEQHGNLGSKVELERPEPGPFQEWEIVQLLCRVFRPEEVYVNPSKASDGLELTDVLVIADDVILLLQAKDRPNIPEVIQQSIDRKRKAAKHALTKACRQMKGAIRHAKSQDALDFIVNGTRRVVQLNGRTMLGLIILQEMFDDDYENYSQLVFKLCDETNILMIAMDYSELNQYTCRLRRPADFINALKNMCNHARKSGRYSRAWFT
jgi:hypothetical protein